MAQKKYSKKKLAFFKKHIQAKLDALKNDLDDSKGNLLETNANGSPSLAQESVDRSRPRSRARLRYC